MGDPLLRPRVHLIRERAEVGIFLEFQGSLDQITCLCGLWNVIAQRDLLEKDGEAIGKRDVQAAFLGGHRWMGKCI